MIAGKERKTKKSSLITEEKDNKVSRNTFRDNIAEAGIAPICLVFTWYRASIAEIPLLWGRGGGGVSHLTSHALQGGNTQKRGRGYRTQVAMLRHQKPHSTQ